MNDKELDALLSEPADRKLEIGVELLERQRSGRLDLHPDRKAGGRGLLKLFPGAGTVVGAII